MLIPNPANPSTSLSNNPMIGYNPPKVVSKPKGEIISLKTFSQLWMKANPWFVN